MTHPYPGRPDKNHDHPDHAGYPGEPGYQDGVSYPAEPVYPAEPGYPESSGYPGPGYREGSVYPEPGDTGSYRYPEGNYGDAYGYPEAAAYDRDGYPDQATYPDRAAYHGRQGANAYGRDIHQQHPDIYQAPDHHQYVGRSGSYVDQTGSYLEEPDYYVGEQPNYQTYTSQPHNFGGIADTGLADTASVGRLATHPSTFTPAPPEPPEGSEIVEKPDKPQKKKRHGWIWVLAIIVSILGLGGATFAFLHEPITSLIARFQPAKDYTGGGSGEVLFVVDEGDDGETITNKLVKQGVIASFDAFYPLLLKAQPPVDFQPGAIQLKKKMSAQAALEAIRDPNNEAKSKFVIPEGTAESRILEIVSESSGIPLDDLKKAAAEPPQSYGLPAQAKSLEGFLFPATYIIARGTSAHDVLKELVDRQFQALDEAGVPADKRWETIVLASIVQREAGSDLEDFPKVARVFLNRIAQGMDLQSDATVSYGTGRTGSVWTTDAERADSGNPYNTYVHKGLPPGPISNPGDTAINAAIHPVAGNWLFFVAVNLKTGETVFSNTLAEHDAAVAKLHDWCDAPDNASYCN